MDSGVTRGPGSIGFESEFYYADEFIKSHFIKLKRENGNLGAGTVMAGTIHPSRLAGTALEGGDYEKNIQEIIYPTLWPWSSTPALHMGGWQVSDAFTGINSLGYTHDDIMTRLPDGTFELAIRGATDFSDLNEWWIHINDDLMIEGNERIELSLYRPKSKLYLGGATMGTGFALGRRTAFLTAIDNDFKHGTIRLVNTEYYTDEGTRQVRVGLERVAGSNGQVSVQLHARDLTAQEVAKVKFSKAKPAAEGKPQHIDIAVPAFGYKNHAAIDRRHGFIRGWSATSASPSSAAATTATLTTRASRPTRWAPRSRPITPRIIPT